MKKASISRHLSVSFRECGEKGDEELRLGSSIRSAVSFHQLSQEKDGDTADSQTDDFMILEHPAVFRRHSTFWPSTKEILIRHPSLELLVPAHDCESRKSSPAAAIFNLVATVCGGGVLSLPLAFQRAGVVPSTLLMMFGAVITNFCMYILCSCARRTGGMSYGDVMRNAFGPAAELVATVLLVFLLLLVLVAYMVLLKDIWFPVAMAMFPWLEEQLSSNSTAHGDKKGPNYLLIVLLCCTMPLILQRDLHALRHTCYIGFASAVVLALGMVHRSVQLNFFVEPGLFWTKVKWFGDLDGILFAFPIIILSYFSIYNVLSVHSALVNPTRSRVKGVLDGTILVCFV